MSRRLEIIILALVALGAGLVAGITASPADEAGIEVGVGDLRGEILSLFAPPGAVATETNPNYKSDGAPGLLLLPRRPPRTGRATTKR